ncbi:titin-like isoform X1 [Portunus trituberculatus]|uniref:titin-like isoform X1 n=1 Tax=Portunus trituberculatus TaxID=210409 RepID=UPI001E1CD5FC|nr:titin-like isoform X1 [Portunus trituberculatus]
MTRFTGRSLVVVVVVAVVVVVGVAGEKLEHGLELITRGELTGETDFAPQGREDERTSAHRSFPAAPIALTYLPPIQSPLPIEETQGTTTGTSATPGEVFVAPDHGGEILRPFNQAGSHLEQTSQQHHHHHHHLGPFESSQENTPFHTEFQPSTSDQDPDALPAVVPGVILPEVEEDEEEPEFFSKVGESKLALIGGVMGAKTAVLDGLKEARESLVTGLKSAVTAKTEAFGTLTKAAPFEHTPQTAPAPVVPYPIYPPYPKPQQTYPQPSYVYHKASYPQPVYHKPVYHKQMYPVVVYPGYHQYHAKPSPLEALKAKVEGYVETKRAAVSGALAKVEEAKAKLDAKIKGLFKPTSLKKTPIPYPSKPLPAPSAPFYPFRPYLNVPLTPHKGYSIKATPAKPLPAPVHHVKGPVPKPYPVNVYPAIPQPSLATTPAPTPVPIPATLPAASTGPQIPQETYPMATAPQYQPVYAIYPVAASPDVGLKEKLEAKKKQVMGAITGAFAKLKAPFQYLHPSYSYYYAPQHW